METTAAYPVAEFQAEIFRPFLQEPFTLLRPMPPGVASPRVELTLVEVKEMATSTLRPRPPFSLLFALRDAAPLEDRFLHRLVHPNFEKCDLLLSRVTIPDDPRDGTMFYEIVFG